MTRVVLDANALMMPFEFGMNIDSELRRLLGECDVIVPSSVMAELAKLAARDKAAKSGLKLAGKYRTVAVEGEGDEAVVEAAVKLEAAVLTNDEELLRKLKKMGIPRIRLRSRSHLVIEGE